MANECVVFICCLAFITLQDVVCRDVNTQSWKTYSVQSNEENPQLTAVKSRFVRQACNGRNDLHKEEKPCKNCNSCSSNSKFEKSENSGRKEQQCSCVTSTTECPNTHNKGRGRSNVPHSNNNDFHRTQEHSGNGKSCGCQQENKPCPCQGSTESPNSHRKRGRSQIPHNAFPKTRENSGNGKSCGCQQENKPCPCQSTVIFTTECPRSHGGHNEINRRQSSHLGTVFSRPCTGNNDHRESEPKKRSPKKDESGEEKSKKRRRKKPTPTSAPFERSDDSGEGSRRPPSRAPFASQMSYRGFQSSVDYRPVGKSLGWSMIRICGKIAHLKRRVTSIIFGREQERPRHRPTDVNKEEEDSGMVHLMKFMQSKTGKQMMRTFMSGMAGS